jgi:hypothetical protein
MKHLRTTLTGLLLLGAFPVASEAGGPNGKPSVPTELRAGSGELAWHWKPIANSNKHALYVNEINVGVYDRDDGTYRRVNSDGTLSPPSTPPWELMKQLEKDPPPHQDPPPPKPKEEPEEEEEEEESLFDMYFKDAPSWLPYAIGGVIALLVCGVGLIFNARRG